MTLISSSTSLNICTGHIQLTLKKKESQAKPEKNNDDSINIWNKPIKAIFAVKGQFIIIALNPLLYKYIKQN